MSTHEIVMIGFIVVTALAIVIQTGVLLALYIAVKKSSVRIETLAGVLESRALPALDLARGLHGMLQEYRPKLDVLVSNLAESSATVKQQIVQVDAALTEVLQRARLQAAQADEVLTRTLARVDNTAETIHHSLIVPVRQVGGVLQGISAGLAAFFNRRRGQVPAGPPKDEWFI
jgi:hypothetical protein